MPPNHVFARLSHREVRFFDVWVAHWCWCCQVASSAFGGLPRLVVVVLVVRGHPVSALSAWVHRSTILLTIYHDRGHADHGVCDETRHRASLHCCVRGGSSVVLI